MSLVMVVLPPPVRPSRPSTVPGSSRKSTSSRTTWSSDLHRPRVGVVEAGHEPRDGGLTAPGSTEQAEHRAWLQPEVDVVEDHLVFRSAPPPRRGRRGGT